MKSKVYLIFLTLMASTFQINAQVDLPNGLVALYTFTGNVNDESVNNNNGQLLGGASANDTLRIKDNDIDAVSIPNNVINGLGDFSFSLEVKFEQFRESTTEGTSNFIIGGWSSQGNNDINFEYIKQRLSGTQVIENLFQIFIGGDRYEFSNIELSENIWYHVVLIRDGGTLDLYLDGAKIGTGITVNTTPIDVIQNGLIVGQEQDALGGGFQLIQSLFGKIDNLYFYNRAINDEEVTAILNGGLVTSLSELISIQNKLSIYPNPTNSSKKLFIENKSNKKITKISLISGDGKVLQSIKVNSNSDTIEFRLQGNIKVESISIISMEIENKFSISKILIRN